MEPKTANNFFLTHRPTDRQTLGLIEVPSRNLKKNDIIGNLDLGKVSKKKNSGKFH